MRNDHAAVCDVGRDLAQPIGDVFVGQAMKAVATDAFRIEALGDGVVIGDRAMAAMEGGVEAGDLRQVREARAEETRIGARLFGWCSGASGTYRSRRCEDHLRRPGSGARIRDRHARRDGRSRADRDLAARAARRRVDRMRATIGNLSRGEVAIDQDVSSVASRAQPRTRRRCRRSGP